MEKEQDSLILNININKIKRQYNKNLFSVKLKNNLTKNIMKYLDIESIIEFSKTCIYIFNIFIDYENESFYNTILTQGKNSFYEINTEENKKCLGYLAQLNFLDHSICTLITTNHIITNEKSFRNKNYKIIINSCLEKIEITLNDRKSYIDNYFPVSIIELKDKEAEKYNQVNYFKIDDKFYENNDDVDIPIYILYYSQDKKINISFGKIKSIKGKILFFESQINNYPEGSPIFNLKNKKIIGFLKQYNKEKNRYEALNINDNIYNCLIYKNYSESKCMVFTKLIKEIRRFSKNPEYIYINPENKDNIFEPLRNWKASLTIIDECPYKGGVFNFEIEIPADYPFLPPKIYLKTKIYHPNFFNVNNVNDYYGRIGLDVLRDEWTNNITISEVLIAIYHLIVEPNPDRAIFKECADLMKKDKEQFEKIAKEWTEKYAMCKNDEVNK